MLAEERALRDEARRFFESQGFLAPIRYWRRYATHGSHDVEGSINGEHGVGSVKRQAFLERTSARGAELMRRIGSAVAPRGAVNPGRIFESEAGGPR